MSKIIGQEGPYNIRMMPGQVPYTAEELKKLYRLLGEAGGADITEANEAEVLRKYREVK